MTVVTEADLRGRLGQYLDEAVDSRAPIVVLRQGAENVVLMSEAEFLAWQETAHLMRSPANARRLMESIDEANAGRTTEHDLAEASTDADV